MRFVICHEYSHVLREYGVHEAATVADYLICEGLAMVVGETFAGKPNPYPWDEVTSLQEREFWDHVDIEAPGLEGYMTYMGSEISYEAGARIVRSYVARHRISIVEAHSRTNDELFWNSGYASLPYGTTRSNLT
jgi:uncharacterized protein YjaZ